jgi:hypothetical protein
VASDIDGGIIVEVLPRCDQGIAISVLEADTISVVNAVEVLDSSDDRLCGVVLVDLDPQWDSSPGLGSIIQQQLE